VRGGWREGGHTGQQTRGAAEGWRPTARTRLQKELLCCYSKGGLGLKGSAPGPKKRHKRRKMGRDRKEKDE
jgi:hypothetical protein